MGDLPAQFNQEQMVSSLKHRLEGWRELILPLHSVLLWQNPWHTAILFEGIFFIFLVIWWCDLSLISLFAIIGAIITSIDYIGPIAIRTISDSSQWNNKKEKNFEDICKSVVSAQITWSHLLQRIQDLKNNQPLLVCHKN
ncbi:hypothetical protein J437_LFUL002383 [Ladona fulva]|uniref:RETREG1-3/ARL6IP-like N-terminal reticulon-homology domain-containing protein n=1 Tax=Ladona fulva TaxID=123851 RepID=A0A8K0P1B0_LADFU|nr:hypothetical protein J437_LFUL002383 [Ladona fulva]